MLAFLFHSQRLDINRSQKRQALTSMLLPDVSCVYESKQEQLDSALGLAFSSQPILQDTNVSGHSKFSRIAKLRPPLLGPTNRHRRAAIATEHSRVLPSNLITKS